jgi:hypothetical protein
MRLPISTRGRGSSNQVVFQIFLCLGWEDSNLQMSFRRCLLQLMGERPQVPQCSLKPKTIRPVFQWLTENNVCEFESSHPSQAGRSHSPRLGTS